MPELPEVETIKEALRKSIDGTEILSVLIRNRNFRQRIPDDFEKIVTGTRILSVCRRAKYVIITLDNGYCIIWHFGMSGRVKIISNPDNLILDKHDHIVIRTSGDTLVFNDARRFGLMLYTKTETLTSHPLFTHLGPDPFEAELTSSYLADKFKNKKTAIKIALLDQDIVNGIGNIYASEALYDARISPLKACCDLSVNELKRLISSVRMTLKKAIAAGGSTLKDYRQPDGSMGYFQNQHCVYGKEGQPCPNCTCKNKIKKIVQGGRSTFYCEKLQK